MNLQLCKLVTEFQSLDESHDRLTQKNASVLVMDSSLIFLAATFLLQIPFTEGFRAYDYREPSSKLLYKLGTPCTYSYQVTVHTARGSKSTANQGYELHTLV